VQQGHLRSVVTRIAVRLQSFDRIFVLRDLKKLLLLQLAVFVGITSWEQNFGPCVLTYGTRPMALWMASYLDPTTQQSSSFTRGSTHHPLQCLPDPSDLDGFFLCSCHRSDHLDGVTWLKSQAQKN
jgi:hypothetical protein